MGLCKCPKRRVTTQFCFEHRVNVCEHCLLAGHPKCVVQSYIQWLQDSDYNPICELCNDLLNKKECLRLVCYHVYHWSCLESMYRSLPRTTAPAGYQCPSCHSGIFPPSNLVSPIADVLREKLSGVNWARAGLGLPLLSDDIETKLNSHSISNSDSHFGPNGHLQNSNSSYSSGYSGHNDSTASISSPQRVTPIGASDDESISLIRNSQYSIQVQEDGKFDSAYGPRTDSYQGNPMTRKIFESDNQKRNTSSRFDHDEDKYKRKSAFEWLVRWWKNALPPAQKRRTASGFFSKRNMMTFILIVIVFTTIVALLMKIGRASIENDQSFNPENNVNIHISK